MGTWLPVILGAVFVSLATCEVFLVPFLFWGPNNQIQELRETAALASALGGKVIAGGIMPHPTDMDESHRVENMSIPRDQWRLDTSAKHIMPVDLVLNRSSIKTIVSVVSLDEAVNQYGWDGRLDLVLWFMHESSGQFINESISRFTGELWWQYNYGILDAIGARYINMQPFNCSSSDIDRVRATIGKRTFVGVITFGGSATSGVFNGLTEPNETNTTCGRAAAEIIINLRFSDTIITTSHDFIHRHVPNTPPKLLAPGPQPAGVSAATATSSAIVPSSSLTPLPLYIALHIRPWPDQCMEYWIKTKGPLEPEALLRNCMDPNMHIGNPNLMRDIVSLLLDTLLSPPFDALLHAGQVPRIFVMCHPKIRYRVWVELRRHLKLVVAAAAQNPPPPPPLQQQQLLQSSFTPENVSMTWARKGINGSAQGGKAFGRLDVAEALLAASHRQRKCVQCSTRGDLHPWESAESTIRGSPPGAPTSLPRGLLFFLREKDLPPTLLGTHETQVSLLGFVEEVVCAEAHTFISTAVSSMSANIVQLRWAMSRQDTTGARAGFRTLPVIPERAPPENHSAGEQG